MPQAQNIVPLILNGPPNGTAIATGNNASWLCPCGHAAPLIGRSGLAAGVTPALRVDCPGPGCPRQFFVVPDGGDYMRVLHVEEV